MSLVTIQVQDAKGVQKDVVLDTISGQTYVFPGYKLYVGAEDVNDGPVSASNPLPVTGNVSARSDDRGYYNSRDDGQCYAMTYEHSASANGEYSFYLQNTSTDKTLVVSVVSVNADNVARCKLWFVTGTAANGTSRVPRNLNDSSLNVAASTAIHDGGGTAISGLSTDGINIDDIRLGANDHRELILSDRVRLGEDSAIALEMDTGTSTPLIHGVILFYYE